MTTELAPTDEEKRQRLKRNIAATWSWFFLAALIIVFEVWTQIKYEGASFVLNPYNLRSIALFAAIPLLLGAGQTFVIISGGIDLSVGFILGLSGVFMAIIMVSAAPVVGQIPALILGCIAALAITLVPGAINGTLISRLNVPPFIGTLGMFGVARGVAFLLAGGSTVPVNNDFLFFIGNGSIFYIPTPIIITVVVVAVLHYVLSQTRFGQFTYAIGGNRNAASRAGIPVKRHTLQIYLISAFCAGVAAIIYTARFSAGAPQAGEPLLLDSIAAVVIGGASLFGGSGTIIGTVIGALIIAVIQYGLVFVDVEPFWQFVAVGTVIIVSVLVDQTQSKITGEERADG